MTLKQNKIKGTKSGERIKEEEENLFIIIIVDSVLTRRKTTNCTHNEVRANRLEFLEVTSQGTAFEQQQQQEQEQHTQGVVSYQMTLL